MIHFDLTKLLPGITTKTETSVSMSTDRTEKKQAKITVKDLGTLSIEIPYMIINLPTQSESGAHLVKMTCFGVRYRGNGEFLCDGDGDKLFELEQVSDKVEDSNRPRKD